MAFKTFVAGAVLTAADVNTYLQKQAVIVCTSGTRPASPAEGFTIYETDTDRTLIYDGAAWIQIAGLSSNSIATYTPTLTQSSTVTATATENTYQQIGNVVEAWVSLTVTGSGTGGSSVIVSLPVTASAQLAAASGTSGTNIGSASIYDTSATTNYVCEAFLRTTGQVAFRHDTTTTSEFGGTPNVALAAGDVVKFHIRYLV